MKPRVLLIALISCVVSLYACSSPSSKKILSIFFDGVPQAKKEEVPAEPKPGSETESRVLTSGYVLHGPYAAKDCSSCHERQTNTLVAPADELCFRCHDFPQNKKYVHGPLASGGCLVCHDPHRSRYRFLLVSESDTFCLHCHDVSTHFPVENECTFCHEAHMSDNEYLLK